jgi:hypothetical protein
MRVTLFAVKNRRRENVVFTPHQAFGRRLLATYRPYGALASPTASACGYGVSSVTGLATAQIESTGNWMDILFSKIGPFKNWWGNHE